MVYLLWTKIRPKEEPVMEKNPDYNDDEEYYDEHDNRVVDNNGEMPRVEHTTI